MDVFDDLEERPRPPRRRRRRGARLAAVLVFVVLIAALVGGAVLGGRAVYSAIQGPQVLDWSGSSGTGSVVVQVRSGDTATDIGGTLADAGVVRSAGAFSAAAEKDTRARTVQPGFYKLRSHMSGAAAVALLLDPASKDFSRVTLPEGTALADALQKIAASSKIPLADLDAAAKDPSRLGLPAWAGGSLEGFLFPATYDVQPGESAEELLRTMVRRFTQAEGDLNLDQRAAAIGQTPYAVLITASLIEKETAYAPDRPKVARVVYNRLGIGMPLQFDSTVNYTRTEKKARLSDADVLQESAYNTYLNKGLPPTPIDSPGEEAIEAALQPDDGDYLYFVTVSKDGSSLFTKDYQAFLAAKAKAQADGVY